jgi:hypothetical protein
MATKLADVKKARPVDDSLSLPNLIDAAGRLKDERAPIDAAYKVYREQIELEMQRLIPAGEKADLYKEGTEFYATYRVGVAKRVSVKKLFKDLPNLFWELCTVPTGALIEILGEVKATQYLNVTDADTPTLDVRRKKKSAAEKIKSDLKSVA